jgi:hypothetical protein
MRSFAIGAVMQHFPKTLARIEGVDFRLPTEEELDALEAFQLSLGRQQDVDLDALVFLDEAAERGRALFEGEGINRSCSFCHSNAGANVENVDDVTGEVTVFNDNFDTGTRTLDVGATVNHPPDGGFDVVPFDGIPGLGNGTFNTPSLIEAADTPPFFHNNAAATLEDAITFYTSDNFAQSPSGQNGGAFQLNDEDIADIAAFLRVMNAMSNAESALTVLNDIRLRRDDENIQQVLSDIQDGMDVLAESELAPSVQETFLAAGRTLESQAAGAGGVAIALLSSIQPQLVAQRIPDILQTPAEGVAAASPP